MLYNLHQYIELLELLFNNQISQLLGNNEWDYVSPIFNNLIDNSRESYNEGKYYIAIIICVFQCSFRYTLLLNSQIKVII